MYLAIQPLLVVVYVRGHRWGKKEEKITYKRKAPYAFISFVIKRSMDTANIIRNLEHDRTKYNLRVNASWARMATEVHEFNGGFPCPESDA